MRGDHPAHTKVRCGMRYKSETDSYIRADDTLMLFIIIIIIIILVESELVDIG